MHLGTRKIRSAGRTSGSVEITLPTTIQMLEGIECQLILRDGPRPEIVLMPDLTAAHDLFRDLWHKIQIGLGEVGDLPDFSLADFTPTFFSGQQWQERPPLSYSDALIIIQKQALRVYSDVSVKTVAEFLETGSSNGRTSGLKEFGDNYTGKKPALPDYDALARVLAALGVSAGYHLGLKGRNALALGDSLAYLVTANTISLGVDFERGMAHRLFWGEDSLPKPFEHPFDDRDWQQARSGFRRVFDQFLGWQERPTVFSGARDQWYRALSVELKNI